jgi:hypothetical protein
MLWITGAALLGIWFVAKFVLGKTGMVHVLLMGALTFFVIQLVQDRRTKAYYRYRNSDEK